METMIGDGQFKAKPPLAKSVMYVFVVAALVLMVPLVAMQFTNEVTWDLFDFAVAGVLLVGTGLMYVLASRKVSNPRYRAVAVAGLGAAFLLVWAELAVGIFH